jgi:transcriptional regulator with XRE-family HTH domain
MEELKRLRKVKGLSQAKLAVMAGLDPSTVSQIETGARRANTRTLERLATVLGTEVADLFPKAQAPLPEFEERRPSTFAAYLDEYKSLRPLISAFDDLEPRERRPVFERCWQLKRELYRAYDPANLELALLHDVMHQTLFHMIGVYKLEQERGTGADVPDIEEYRARLRQSA